MSDFDRFCERFAQRITKILRNELLVAYAQHIHPKHFQNTNVVEYRYRPLSRAYATYKLRRVGARPMLVYSGRLARSSWSISGGRLRFYVPSYAKYVNEQRPLFALSARDRRILLSALKQQLRINR